MNQTLSLAAAIAAVAVLVGIDARAADPAPPVPHQPVCNFDDGAVVSLSVKKGEVAALIAYLNNPESVTLGQAGLLTASVKAQLAALQTKYCK